MVFIFHIFDVITEGLQKLFLTVQAAQDPFIQRIVGTDITDMDILFLADPVYPVLALQAGGQVPAVGEINNIVAELQIQAVAGAVTVGNEEIGLCFKGFQILHPFFMGMEPSKRAICSSPYLTDKIRHNTSIS